MAKKKLIKVINEKLWRDMKAISILRERKLEDIIEEAFREFIDHHAKQYNTMLWGNIKDEGTKPNK